MEARAVRRTRRDCCTRHWKAASLGAEMEYIDLYPLKYKGCLSCFYCKRKDKEHGVCIVKDDLAPVLERAKQADALLFGFPIYFMNLTSGMQAFLERFFFSQYIYSRKSLRYSGRPFPLHSSTR